MLAASQRASATSRATPRTWRVGSSSPAVRDWRRPRCFDRCSIASRLSTAAYVRQGCFCYRRLEHLSSWSRALTPRGPLRRCQVTCHARGAAVSQIYWPRESNAALFSCVAAALGPSAALTVGIGCCLSCRSGCERGFPAAQAAWAGSPPRVRTRASARALGKTTVRTTSSIGRGQRVTATRGAVHAIVGWSIQRAGSSLPAGGDPARALKAAQD